MEIEIKNLQIVDDINTSYISHYNDVYKVHKNGRCFHEYPLNSGLVFVKSINYTTAGIIPAVFMLPLALFIGISILYGFYYLWNIIV